MSLETHGRMIAGEVVLPQDRRLPYDSLEKRPIVVVLGSMAKERGVKGRVILRSLRSSSDGLCKAGAGAEYEHGVFLLPQSWANYMPDSVC
jgi:hypothetical protein